MGRTGPLLVSLLALLRAHPAALAAQQPSGGSGGFTPGNRELVLLDFTTMGAGGGFPKNLTFLSMVPTMGSYEGTPMLMDKALAELLITLAEVLPRDFTLEIDLVPRAWLCLPPDLMFAGTRSRSRSANSAEVVWSRMGVVVAGGGPYVEVVKQ